MIRVQSSMDIMLRAEPTYDYGSERKRDKCPIIPLSSTEASAATRGLSKHIEILHKGVRRTSLSDEAALLAVYNFMFDQVDVFRQQAQNTIGALNLDSQPWSYYAAAITPTRLGYESLKTGKWLRGKQKEQRLTELFHDTVEQPESVRPGYKQWAFLRARNSRMFWLDQLERTRTNPLILEIAQKVQESTTDEVEV
ncbi:MAG: hypothetical protein Q7R60_02805 [bacterium]|nr:hypothetical protein [bacterium]